ncbi:hypothetical protein PENTCL1PPCAC_1027, partial [Pristionchus entomophagus]
VVRTAILQSMGQWMSCIGWTRETDLPKDLLSNLPDECLIEIFQHLTRTDIYNMRTVNKRMLPFYSNRAVD